MKYLNLVFVLFTFSTNINQKPIVARDDVYQQYITEVQIQKILVGLDNKDYSVLDLFLSKKHLFPYITVQEGYMLTYDITKPLNIGLGEYTYISNQFFLSNVEAIVSYTNQYGVIIYNDQNILISQKDWNRIAPQPNNGFSETMNKSFETKDIQKIIALYDSLYDSSIYIAPHWSFVHVYNYIDQHYKGSNSDYIDRLKNYIYNDDVLHYIYQKTFPTDNTIKLRTALLNHWAYIFYTQYKDNGYTVPQYPL